jgi:hypothetical protein
MSSSPNKPIKADLEKQGQYISPFVSNGDTFRSADKTSYDLTNDSPLGGPVNAPRYQHTHKYSPYNKYLDNFQEAASPNSAFGTEGDKVLPGSVFEKTKLDTESPLPADLGGPNRTNAVNIPNGMYTNNRSGNKYGESTGGPLKNKEGKIINNLIQQYSTKSTYLDKFDGLPFTFSKDLPSIPQTEPTTPEPTGIILDIKKNTP